MADFLITRAEPAASETAKAVISCGHQPVLCPIFELQDTGKEIPQTGFDGIILTSSNAVEILKLRNWKPEDNNLPVFCVGTKTTELATRLGFKNIHQGEGSAESLIESIADYGFGQNAKLLYPAAINHSFDFKPALASKNIILNLVEIYQTVATTPDKEVIFKAFDQCHEGYALIYSRRSGEHLGDIIRNYDLGSRVGTITAIGISENAVSVIREFPWKNVMIAQQPDEASMLKLLR